jgi:hypothetical protein
MQPRLSVEVHKVQCLLGQFVTRDIDQAGVFLEAMKIDVHPNDILELVFRHAERGSREYISRATVMRLEADGVGLMFLEGDGNAAPELLSDNRLVAAIT